VLQLTLPSASSSQWQREQFSVQILTISAPTLTLSGLQGLAAGLSTGLSTEAVNITNHPQASNCRSRQIL
jgi:hypothetical protein